MSGILIVQSVMLISAHTYAPILGSIVGIIHYTHWNATFANSNGQQLWRICCIVQISVPVYSLLLGSAAKFLVGGLGSLCGGVSEERADIIHWIIVGFSFFLYFCARIVLFILLGYSFWSMPTGVYTDVDWTWTWFPHWH